MEDDEQCTPLWVKFGSMSDISFVGNHVICVGGGGGSHLLFHNIMTGENLFYRANSKQRGDGIKCFDGHKKFPVIAFAEDCLNPRIFVMAHPSFETIVQMKNAAPIGYLQIAFSVTEYLVALTSLPEFAVIVWIWRTGEKLAVKKTNITYDNQILVYSNGSSFVQAARHTLRSFNVWDLHVCGKRCALSSVTSHLSRGKHAISDIFYASNSSIMTLDAGGNVYEKRLHESKSDLIIEWNREFSLPDIYVPCFTWHLDGIVVMGPTLDIIYYIQDAATQKWVEHINIKTDYAFHLLVSISLNNVTENLYGASTDGRIALVDFGDHKITHIQTFSTGYIGFAFIWPLGENVITLNKYFDVSVWEIESGKLISVMHLLTSTECMFPNPEWPVVIFGRTDGTVLFLNAYDVTCLSILMTLRLMKHPIQLLHGSTNGQYILAGNNTHGIYFVLKGEPKTGWSVISHIDFSAQIVHGFMWLYTEKVLKLYFLHVTSNTFVVGDKVTIVTLNLPDQFDKNTFVEPEKQSMDLLSNYSQIKPICTDPKKKLFYGVPHGSRQFHTLMSNEEANKFMLVETKHSGHQLSLYSIYLDPYHLITYGYDGMCFIYDPEGSELLCKALLHHRLKGGIESVVVDPTGRHVVSMSRAKSLVCSKLHCKRVVDINLINSLKKKVQQDSFKDQFIIEPVEPKEKHVVVSAKTSVGADMSESIREMHALHRLYKGAKETTLYYQSVDESKVPTWLELVEQKKLMSDAIECAEARHEIFNDLKSLRQRLSEMLDANERAPENEKLPISAFNLDEEWVESKQDENNYNCEKLKYYLENLIIARNKVAEYIKGLLWEPIKVKHRTLRALYGTLEVDNYPIIPDTVQEKEDFETLRIRRQIENLLSKEDIFTPWVVYQKEALEEFLKKPPCVSSENEATRILEAMEKDEAEADAGAEHTAVEYDETNRIMYGTTTHLYIDTSAIPKYTQFENHSFLQFSYENISYTHSCKQLCLYFNKRFDEIGQFKARELQVVTERIARFRHILSELHNSEIIVREPHLPDTEIPERLIKVEPNEVPITPYISPSQQAILDAEAAERERIRLLLLADDFRERALMKMMDGVLEIRWEDEIKKDIPKPQCMLEKDPKNYNEEDLVAIREYEKKVEFLMSERERYRKMLEVEYQKLAVDFRDSVKKFNERLGELSLLKLRIASSLIQEQFNFANKRKIHFERILNYHREKEAVKAIADNEIVIETIQNELSYLNIALNECRGNMETLVNKDRLLEKNYRKDLPKISSLSLEAYFKVVRRRPRYHLKSTSPTLYYQLASCLNSLNRPLFLPDDSVEYLKSLDILDQMVGVPNVVSEDHFDAIRRVRRNKIESEIRIKGMSFELAEAEATILFFQKRLAYKRDLRDKLVTKLQKARADQLFNSHNIQVQLVLKQGLVEVAETGYIKDFQNALLVNRSQVLEVNELINKSGRIKLEAMYKDMIFRRQILQTEWDHQHKVMEIEDLQNFMRTIQQIKLYRDVIDYLKIKAKGVTPEKTMFSLDKEEANIREAYLRMIAQRENSVRDIEERIAIKKQDTERLNKKINEINIDVWEEELQRNKEFEAEYQERKTKRLETIMKRGKIVRKIQKQFSEMLILQTELELLRLRTYPTLKYNPLNS